MTQPVTVRQGSDILKARIEQAQQIVAKLAKADELVTEAERLLRDAEALMRADEVSTVAAAENAREAAELIVVLRVGFHRRLREVLTSWQGYHHARNR